MSDSGYSRAGHVSTLELGEEASVDKHHKEAVPSTYTHTTYSWTPPSPPTSSSPIRNNEYAANAFSIRCQQAGKPSIARESSAGPPRRLKPLVSRRQATTRHTSGGFRRSPAQTSAPTLQSGSAWHSRFTLQCTQRARGERQKTINEHRNGLVNDVIRPEYETREEIAIWRRMALQEKHALEMEADRVLKNEYEHILEDIEHGSQKPPESEDAFSEL